mgnify:FL=1
MGQHALYGDDSQGSRYPPHYYTNQLTMKGKAGYAILWIDLPVLKTLTGYGNCFYAIGNVIIRSSFY